MRPSRPPARGAALLVVIVSTAILTAIAVDLAYSTRVSLLTAANSRDELRAEYLARGGAQLSRLILMFQVDLDDKGQANPGAAAAGLGVPRIQIWSLVPMTSAFTDALFGGAAEGGGPRGTFEAKIEDEQRKVNAQLDGSYTNAGSLVPQVQSLLMLMLDPKWDPLFDREDSTGLKVTRQDVAIYLHDWTDPNSVASSFDPTAANPFPDGFGDENQPYSRQDPPYQVKNARFDSLDELYLVAGIDDAFMEAFGSQLTVFPTKDGLININTLESSELLQRARICADPPDQPQFYSSSFELDLRKAIALRTFNGMLSISAPQFVEILGASIRLKANCEKAFTDRSLVYRIHATGAAGATERRVDAVVSFEKRQQEPAGRLLHWREE